MTMTHSVLRYVAAPRPKLVLVVWLFMAACLPVLWWRKGWLDGVGPRKESDDFFSEKDLSFLTRSEPVGRDSYRSWFLESVKQSQMSTTNTKAPVMEDGVKKPEAFLQALLQYPYLGDKLKQGKVPVGVGDHRKAHADEVRRRQSEYHQAMFWTLSHPVVANLHVLLNRSEDLSSLYVGLKQEGMRAGMTEGECIRLIAFRLITHTVGHQMTYGDAFEYANRHMEGQYVLVLNSDVYPMANANGWRELRPHHFGQHNRTVFMLSRETPACPGRTRFGLPPHPAVPCQRMARWGSADAFVFRAPVPATVVRELISFPTNYWGAENRAAAAMKRAGFGPFLNPCEVLRMGHNHCSRVRVTGWNAPRINQGRGRSVVSRFLTQLPGD